MVCPFCLHKKTEVYNSRATKKLGNIWRRRRCMECGKQFTTRETTDPASVLRIGTKSKAVPFSYNKLLLSILKSCDHRTDTDESVPYLCETTKQRLYKLGALQSSVVSSAQICETTLAVLKNYDVAAYVKYLSYHSGNLDKRSLKQHIK